MSIARFCPGTFLVLAILALPLAADDPPKAGEAIEQSIGRFALSGSLEDVLNTLAEKTSLKIVPDWQEIEATGVKRTDRVVLRGRKETLGQILDLLLAQAARRGKPLSWFIDPQGRIIVSTQARVLTRTTPRAQPTQPRQTSPAIGEASAAPRPAPAPPDQRPEIRFDNIALENVIEYLREMTGINYHVNWNALETVGIGRQTPVQLQASNMRLGSLLDLICQGLNGDKDKYSSIYWVVDGGVVRISTGTALNRIMRTRVYDISDLLMIVPNFQPSRVEANSVSTNTGSSSGSSSGSSGGLFDSDSGNGEDGDEGQSAAEQRQEVQDSLLDLIRNSIGQDMWKTGGGQGSITILQNRGQMVITQSLLGFKLMEETIR